jgi:hypothetical protein
MKTLIYSAGPIGQWLARRPHQAGKDVTLLARNSFERLERDGVVVVDGLAGGRLTARAVGTELLELAGEFRLMAFLEGVRTPTSEELIESARLGETGVGEREVA